MTLRELLAAVVQAHSVPANNADEWIDIRNEKYPWRHIVDAAERGECEVARVGRRLLMQRRELSRWLSTRRITSAGKSMHEPDPDHESENELQRSARVSLERVGFRRQLSRRE